jgi:UDP-perosamine 4-acetyltransferase
MTSPDARPPLVIVGAGDHGRVIADLAGTIGRVVVGYVQPTSEAEAARGIDGLGLEVIGSLDDDLPTLAGVEFTVALGGNEARARAFARCLERGWRPATLVHPAAVQLGGAWLGAGVQVCAGAVIGVAASIADDVIVNTAATVDHDARIGEHAFIGPGAHLAGRVTVEPLAHVGIGAVVREGCTIGRQAYVAAGAVVVGDVGPGTRVAGVPARTMDQAPDQEAR